MHTTWTGWDKRILQFLSMPCQEIRLCRCRDVTEPHHLGPWAFINGPRSMRRQHQDSEPDVLLLTHALPSEEMGSQSCSRGESWIFLTRHDHRRFNGRGVVPVVTVTSTSCRIGCGPDAALPVPCPTYHGHQATSNSRPNPTYYACTGRPVPHHGGTKTVRGRRSGYGRAQATYSPQRPNTGWHGSTRLGACMYSACMYYPSTLSDVRSGISRRQNHEHGMDGLPFPHPHGMPLSNHDVADRMRRAA